MIDVITVEFIVVTVTLLALAIGMFHQTRCMRRDMNIDIKNKATHEAKINSTLERVSEQLATILQRLAKADEEMRAFTEWKIRTEEQLKRLDSKVEKAHSRTDDYYKKMEYLKESIPVSISTLQSP